jgi:hypothetical protein
MRNKFLIPVAGVWSVLLTGLVLSKAVSARERQLDMVASLRAKDSLQLLTPVGPTTPLARGFAASFIMRTESLFDPAQGKQFNVIEVAWSQNWCVMKATSLYEHEPVFRLPGTAGYRPIEHDSEGNLIVWRPLAKYTLSTKEQNDTSEKSAMYVIDPAGKTIATNIYTKLLRFRIGDRNNVYIFDQFRMATGWGFGEQLRDITANRTDVTRPGFGLLEATGGRGVSLEGKWEITYELGPDPLVRQARFFVDSDAQPILETANSGLMEAPGIRIAKLGHFRSGAYEAHFQVLSLRALDDSEGGSNPLYKEVSKEVAGPLPRESEVIDFRGERPKVIRTEVDPNQIDSK